MPRPEFLQQVAHSVDALASQLPSADKDEIAPEEQPSQGAGEASGLSSSALSDAVPPEADSAVESESEANLSGPENLPPLDGEFDYVDTDGRKHHVTYVQGQQTGPFQQRDSESQLELSGTLLNGLPEGPLETYDQGVLQSRVEMANGVPHGKMTLFSADGRTTAEIVYQEGQRHGEMKTFYANGNVQNLVTYENDKKNGVMETYTEAGELMARVSYKGDSLHGQEVLYDGQGHIISESVYEHGEKVSSTTPQATGT